MSPEKPGQKGDKGKDYRQLALLTAAPAMIIIAPLAGFFVGNWADERVGTDPLFAIVGLVLGFVTAGIEVKSLLKKASDTEDDEKTK